MLTNDQIILKQIIEENCEGEDISINEYFEIYSATEVLKNYDLCYDDILYGISGNGGDGGIDSIYTFINGELIKEDTKINTNSKNNQIDLVIIQSKTSPNFKEAAITKFRETSEDLLNLGNDPDTFLGRYTVDLVEKSKIFRSSFSKLAKTFPKLNIKYFYVTQGIEIHPNVQGKVAKLEETVLKMFGGANFEFSFIGASELLQMTRDVPTTSRTLEVSESPIGTAAGSYVALVNLKKYFEFISENGKLAKTIFDSNVRDYQGSVIVNTAIRQTLSDEKSQNFWYLNNGVTIITPKVISSGKQLTIEDPQIVNGLQTSHEIYQHFSNTDIINNEERSLLVRIICEENEASRDKIIRATNSQTAIPPASLRSADEIHRNIEDFLKPNGFFYDRKKNFHRNQGVQVSKIISIPYMAQAMMAITLLKPDSARARPSTLLNSDKDYKAIFSLDKSIDLYLKVIQIIKIVETYLKQCVTNGSIERDQITNIKYYVAMVTAIKITSSKINLEDKLSGISNIEIESSILEESLDIVYEEYMKLGGNDQVAKGSKLLSSILEIL
ncbi:AIPR family protein [Comamonas thiooxydans]|uniref:AIPR family protein n=1 Tax=Comamonas thiooxydans TaxID=363952 RepID=UPI0009EF3FE7|nr:AIPR family protein [Comamonas thiooxydans]